MDMYTVVIREKQANVPFAPDMNLPLLVRTSLADQTPKRNRENKNKRRPQAHIHKKGQDSSGEKKERRDGSKDRNEKRRERKMNPKECSGIDGRDI